MATNHTRRRLRRAHPAPTRWPLRRDAYNVSDAWQQLDADGYRTLHSDDPGSGVGTGDRILAVETDPCCCNVPPCPDCTGPVPRIVRVTYTTFHCGCVDDLNFFGTPSYYRHSAGVFDATYDLERYVGPALAEPGDGTAGDQQWAVDDFIVGRFGGGSPGAAGCVWLYRDPVSPVIVDQFSQAIFPTPQCDPSLYVRSGRDLRMWIGTLGYLEAYIVALPSPDNFSAPVVLFPGVYVGGLGWCDAGTPQTIVQTFTCADHGFAGGMTLRSEVRAGGSAVLNLIY